MSGRRRRQTCEPTARVWCLASMIFMRTLSTALAVSIAVLSLAGCSGTPRDSFQQYVARDTWDATCAEQGIVEKWVATNGRWKIPNEVWAVDVDATFKLVNECKSGL